MKWFALLGLLLFLGVAVAPCFTAGIIIKHPTNKTTFDDENIFCFILAKVRHSRPFKNSLIFDNYHKQLRSIGPHINSFLSFGEYRWSSDGYEVNYSAQGVVKTYGLSGEKTWEGNHFWGNLHTIYITRGIGMDQWHEYYYAGVNHFTGIILPCIWTQDSKIVVGDLIIGRAMRVSITYDCPI